MKNKIAILACLTAGMLSVGSVAQAQDTKIGVVSMERVLSQAQAAHRATERLTKEAQEREQSLESMTKRFKARAMRFEKSAPTMTENSRVMERRELAEMERDLMRRNREAKDEFNQRRNEELMLLQSHTRRIINEIAQKENYDLVLFEYLYASKAVDITDKVIKVLDREEKKLK